MKRRHIRHWSWGDLPGSEFVSPGSEVCYDMMFGRGHMLPGISQWAWDILIDSEAWQSLSKAANELHEAVVLALREEAQP